MEKSNRNNAKKPKNAHLDKEINQSKQGKKKLSQINTLDNSTHIQFNINILNRIGNFESGNQTLNSKDKKSTVFDLVRKLIMNFII